MLALVGATLWAAQPAVAADPFEAAIAASRSPASEHVARYEGMYRAPGVSWRKTAKTIWRRGHLVRMEEANTRSLADCRSGAAWRWENRRVLALPSGAADLCGISSRTAGGTPVRGGVTALPGGERLVVVPDHGFERWHRLRSDGVVGAYSLRSYGVPRGPDSWMTLVSLGRCIPPDELFSPAALEKKASFHCPASSTEALAPITAEGLPPERWRDGELLEQALAGPLDSAAVQARLNAYLARVEEENGPRSVAYAEALQCTGVTLYNAGLRDRSLFFLERSATLYRDLLPNAHPLATLADKTFWDARAGARGAGFGAISPEEASSLYGRRLRSHGPESPVPLLGLMTLTRAEIRTGSLKPGAPLWAERVAALRAGHEALVRTQGSDWVEVGSSRALLLELYSESRQFDEALSVLDAGERASQAFEAPKRSALYMDLLVNRATILDRAGQSADADQARRRARLLGDELLKSLIKRPGRRERRGN